MQNNQNKNLVLIQDLGMRYYKETSKTKHRFGLYKCFCGKEFETDIAKVKSNHTKSCGCLRGKNNIHNLTNHRLYITWNSMIRRCIYPKNKSYEYYGGRGIKVCDEWLDVRNFIEDMYPTFKEGLSIDRIDVNKGYSPDNCRWATKLVQSRNTRKIMSTNKSGYRGVYLHKQNNKWRAKIKVDYKYIHLGYYEDKFEAAKAYDNYIIENNLEHTKNF